MLAVQMPNGVTVSDWLGTAGVAARLAARTCEEIRERKHTEHAPTALTAAIGYAEQAVYELHAIRQMIETGKVDPAVWLMATGKPLPPRCGIADRTIAECNPPQRDPGICGICGREVPA